MNPILFATGGTSVPGELYIPPAHGRGQGIVVVHGSDGMAEPWGAAIRGYAQDLADRGFTILIPYYFEKTGTLPGIEVLSQGSNLPAWTETIRDACTYAATVAGAPDHAMGLLGFSLGGNLCLRLRSSVRAVVEFFAPELRDWGGIGTTPGSVRPEIQIHHGRSDALVPIAESENISAALKSEGVTPQVFSYEAAGHGFAGADAANATARRVSHDRTLAFFEREMQRS
jgi:dienelactone hydrolase